MREFETTATINDFSLSSQFGDIHQGEFQLAETTKFA